MRCQHCNQNEATTFIKRNINGHKEELHLAVNVQKNSVLWMNFVCRL